MEAPGPLANDNPGAATCIPDFDVTGLIGELDLQPNGAFTYTPPDDFHGETSFVYGLQAEGFPDCLGPADSQATVTLTVNPVNDNPTARADSFQALPDRTLNVASPGVLLNDGDVDGDTLAAVKESNPVHGVVTLASDGAFSYTPNAGYVGPDAFSYRASDGSAMSPVRVVTITVTPIPTPVPTAAPTPTPAAEPTPTVEPSPGSSSEASASPDPAASASALPSTGTSPSPGASLAPDPTAGRRRAVDPGAGGRTAAVVAARVRRRGRPAEVAGAAARGRLDRRGPARQALSSERSSPLAPWHLPRPNVSRLPGSARPPPWPRL